MSLFFGCPQTLFNQGFCYVRNASPVSSFAHELRACPVAWPACPAGGGWPRPAAGARRCTMSDFMSHYLVPAAIVAVAIVLGARPRQHDARRLAQPLAKADAAARAAAIRRHHRDHGDDLDRWGANAAAAAIRRLHRRGAHIFHFFLFLGSSSSAIFFVVGFFGFSCAASAALGRAENLDRRNRGQQQQRCGSGNRSESA